MSAIIVMLVLLLAGLLWATETHDERLREVSSADPPSHSRRDRYWLPVTRHRRRYNKRMRLTIKKHKLEAHIEKCYRLSTSFGEGGWFSEATELDAQAKDLTRRVELINQDLHKIRMEELDSQFKALTRRLER
jgi:hypothetical protein